MAIGLNDVNSGQLKKKEIKKDKELETPIMDLILKKSEERNSPSKARSLRPWEDSQNEIKQYENANEIMKEYNPKKVVTSKEKKLKDEVEFKASKLFKDIDPNSIL